MIIVVSVPKKEEIRAKIEEKTGRSLRQINGSWGEVVVFGN